MYTEERIQKTPISVHTAIHYLGSDSFEDKTDALLMCCYCPLPLMPMKHPYPSMNVYYLSDFTHGLPPFWFVTDTYTL